MHVIHPHRWHAWGPAARTEVELAATLFPAYPHDVGVEDALPDLSRLEGAHLLANEARALLRADRFTDDEIDRWAEAYLATYATATLHDFLSWIAAKEQRP